MAYAHNGEVGPRGPNRRDGGRLRGARPAQQRAGEDRDGELELYYEVGDAVPDSYASKAFHVGAFLEMADSLQPDAHVTLIVHDDNEGVWAADVNAVRGAFGGPGETLEWSWQERMWVPPGEGL